MGSQILSQFPLPISRNCYRRFSTDNYTSNSRRRPCFSGGRSGGSRWDWDENINAGKRSRFSDAYATDDYDEDEFGLRSDAKRRTWWSDDFVAEDDDDDDDEVDEGFGIFEASIGFNWVFKVFRAFGWMIPAVMISLLLGTGPNAIIMALALPLAQTALSLAAETLWGPRPKPKSKKRPFARSTGRTRVRKEKEIRTQKGKEAGDYKSWVDGNNVSAKERRNPRDFGGWDELDNQERANKEPLVTPFKVANESRSQERVKISRRTKGDTPLFMRFLIAMFPYLGFWTKLF